MRVVVLDAFAAARSSSSAYLVDRYSGCRSCATTCGSMSNSRRKCSMPSVNERSVSAFSRSPMWCETKAWRPRARQNVFFSSAPQASTGRGKLVAVVIGSGT